MTEQDSEVVFEVAAKKKGSARKANAGLGIAAGVGVAVAGTALWILMVTRYQAPWMSVLIAVATAFSIRYFAKSTAFWFGVVAALLAIGSAITGNLFTAISIVSKHGGKSTGEILAALDPGTVFYLLSKLTRPIDILMYVGAAVVGFWFAFEHPKPQLPE